MHTMHFDMPGTKARGSSRPKAHERGATQLDGVAAHQRAKHAQGVDCSVYRRRQKFQKTA